MPHQCVRCAGELSEPLPEYCPRCGLLVSRSLPPPGSEQSLGGSADHQALTSDEHHAPEVVQFSPAERVSSSPTVDAVVSSREPEPTRMTPVWLPLSVTAVLSSLLLCGL